MREKKFFDENGYIVIDNFFDKNVLSEIHKNIYDYDHSLIGNKDIVFESDDNAFKYIQNINHYVSECHKLLSFELFNLVQILLGEDCYFVNMEIHNKAAGVGTHTPKHQDNYYFRLNPPQALTAYVPLEMHNAKINGGLKFVQASHKLGTLDHDKSKTKAFSSGLNELAEDSIIYETDMKVGDIVIHHANTIHFADDNNSDFNRNSISIRFNGKSATVDEEMNLKYLENLKFNRQE